MRRNNNFDIIRLVLAWTVVLAHCCDLSLSPALMSKRHLFQSGFAVDGFFAISGCLIVASWDRTRSSLEYFKRRAKRILPAYYLALAFCLILGCIFTSLPWVAFVKNAGTWRYVFSNLFFLNFLHPDLPGVFQSNPLSAMDGALWTIKIEVAFYLFVPVLVWCIRRFGTVLTLSGAYVLSLLYVATMTRLGHESLNHQFPGELSFFLAGIAVYYYFPLFNKYRAAMWVTALVLLPLCFFVPPPAAFVLSTISVPLLTLCVAFLLPAYRGITKYGDFSYGTYVLHFPVIQTLVFFGFFARHSWGAVAVVLVVVSVLSVLSWFAVERVFLRSGRVRQQESETAAMAV